MVGTLVCGSVVWALFVDKNMKGLKASRERFFLSTLCEA